MIQVWHPYTLWEEYHFGMWRNTSAAEVTRLLPLASTFTGDHKLYGKWMMRVLDKWPISCEHNLTNTSINRRAWVGHAACCLATGIPEHITRKAWGLLSNMQQVKANRMADRAIAAFEMDYKGERRQYGFGFKYEAQNTLMDTPMGGEGLPLRNTRRGGYRAGAARESTLLQANLFGNFAE